MMVIILMGVSGSGKTTIGELLNKRLGWKFYDGDDYHPQANIDKMSHGIPLTDADRDAWLDALRQLILKLIENGENGVLACSALKQSYRQRLQVDPDRVKFVYLKGSFELIRQRLLSRQEHFMKASLLPSQFDTLQEPSGEDVLTVDISPPPDVIVDEIVKGLNI